MKITFNDIFQFLQNTKKEHDVLTNAGNFQKKVPVVSLKFNRFTYPYLF